LMMPLLDTLRVFAIRIFYRRSPFSPDRNHIHHLLLDKGFSHRAITLTLVAINLSVVALVYLGRSIGCTLLIFSVIALFFGFILLLYYVKSRPVLTVATKASPVSKQDNIELKPSKLVSFTNDSVLEQKN